MHFHPTRSVGLAAFTSVRGANGPRRVLVERAYGLALVNVAVGATIATLLIGGNLEIGGAWGMLKPAHAWLNLIGFAGLVVQATLLHLAPTIADLLDEKFDPEGKQLVTSFEPENCQIYIDEDRLSKLGLTLRDLAQFLESQPYMFAVFTNDEVRRAVDASKTAKPAQSP